MLVLGTLQVLQPLVVIDDGLGAGFQSVNNGVDGGGSDSVGGCYLERSHEPVVGAVNGPDLLSKNRNVAG